MAKPPCTVRLVANGSTAEPVRVALPPSLGALLELAGATLHMAAHSMFDDEGCEVTDLQQISSDQRLFVCGGATEPFLRNRPKRCQLFRVPHVDPAATPATWATVPDVQDAAVARWHEGKVVPVPSTMADLRDIASERFGLDGHAKNIRFRSAGSGLLIFETAAITDDDLLLVETPTPASTTADVRSLLNGSLVSSARFAGEALDALVGLPTRQEQTAAPAARRQW